MIRYREAARPDLALPAGTYVLEVRPIHADRLAAICSDDSLWVFDADAQRPASRIAADAHDGITCLNGAADASWPYLTAGRDGCIRGWDDRKAGSCLEIKEAGACPVLSMASNTECIAIGTELVNAQATVQVWDRRRPDEPFRRFVESHSDDVTEVAFQPHDPPSLLSGSTDGLVNLYSLLPDDEDDALVEVLNPGSSVHHAGFVHGAGAWAIYALSHDEALALYHFGAGRPADDASRRVQDWGDVRPRVACEYAVDVLPSEQGPPLRGQTLLAAGNPSEQRFDLIPMGSPPEFELRTQDTRRLLGAHGEEIVRSVYIHPSGTIFTGGEDGLVKAWRQELGGEEEGAAQGEPDAKRRRQDENSARKGKHFKPY